jgi:hypothetical protein
VERARRTNPMKRKKSDTVSTNGYYINNMDNFHTEKRTSESFPDGFSHNSHIDTIRKNQPFQEVAVAQDSKGWPFSRWHWVIVIAVNMR